MARRASPFLNLSFPEPDKGAFLIRSARRYHHFKNTMGLKPTRSYTSFLGRVRRAGGVVKNASLAVRGDRLLRFSRGVRGAFAKGHRFFGNQYMRIGASRGGMNRSVLKGLNKARIGSFVRREVFRGYVVKAFAKKLLSRAVKSASWN